MSGVTQGYQTTRGGGIIDAGALSRKLISLWEVRSGLKAGAPRPEEMMTIEITTNTRPQENKSTDREIIV